MADTEPPFPAGRVALVTGANTGIGRVTALELARAGMHVFLACRTEARTRPVVEEIVAAGGKADFLPLELSDFDSVRECARHFLALDRPLHLLINNAGLAGAHGLTKSGFELAFGVNHMGHFLLTQLLLDRMRQSAPARIVTVSSRAHRRVSGIDWDALRRLTATRLAIKEYGVSKLANLLFSAALGRRLQGSGVTTYSLHPGVIASDIWRGVPGPLRALLRLAMITTEEGARTSLHCALSPVVAGETGLYYSDCRAVAPTAVGQDRALAEELWRRSEGWIA